MWDRQLYFPFEGRRAEDFFALKNPTPSAGFEPANLGTEGQYATSRPPKPIYTNVLKNSLHPFSDYMSKLSLEEEDVLNVGGMGLSLGGGVNHWEWGGAVWGEINYGFPIPMSIPVFRIWRTFLR
jgi:hypothetical protein